MIRRAGDPTRQFRIELVRDLAVADFNPARRDGGNFRVVRDERDGSPLLAELAKQSQNRFAGVRVQVGGRFVGESRQPRMCMSVDLPLPDGPMMEMNSPPSMSSDTSSSARISSPPR